MPQVREFIRVDAKGNHNAFFRMTISERIETASGRIAPGEVQAVPGRTYPMAALDLLVRKLSDQGYVERSVSTQTGQYAPIADKEIREYVDIFFKRSRHALDGAYAVKPCDVTAKDIQEARRLVASVRAAGSTEEANDFLQQLYIVLPRKMQQVSDLMVSRMEDVPKLCMRELDLIAIMETQSAVDRGCGGTILDALKLHIQRATEDEKRAILPLLDMDNSRMAGYRIENIFRIFAEKPHAAHEAWCQAHGITSKDLHFLCHGTRTENVLSLASGGFATKSSKKAPRAGSMFGSADDGVFYLAPKGSKSIGYTSIQGSYWARGQDDMGVLFIMRTAYKNPLHLYHQTPGQTSFTAQKIAPHDAVYAHASKGWLHNDEIVIYDPGQAEPTHVAIARKVR